MKIIKLGAVSLGLLLLANVAQAQGIGAWEAAAQAAGAGYTATNITAPTQADIGTYDDSTGVTYEFIYNAQAGGRSSALMGSLGPPVGDSAALKVEQFDATGKFGATQFGVADYTYGTDSIYDAVTHAVFVMDGTDTDFYVNGALAESDLAGSFALSGVTGLGHALRHSNGTGIDELSGSILGVAVYDSAVSAETVAGNFAAFVPEPSSVLLLVLGMLGLISRSRSTRR